MEKVSKSQIKLVRSLQFKKFRDEHRLFVAEGSKLIGELLTSFSPLFVLSTEQALPTLPPELSPELIRLCTSVEIEQASQLRAPQGTIAVLRQPDNDTLLPSVDGCLTLLLDGVQDPGNVGTIIRTANWFGIKQIVCSTDTADCFNPKVVQATMGALAYIKIAYTDLLQYVKDYRSCHPQLPVYGTLLNGQNIYHTSLSTDGLLIMGNEGKGISSQLQELITDPLLIPSFGGKVESLNVAVATGICLALFQTPQ